ncbi:hypothetical protein [Halarchaeum grantii]|nr:hypothetical protein [Halarchaeum grantii]
MDLLVLPLQQVDPFGVQQSLGVAGRAVAAFLGTLIVGALLLAFVEEWFERLLGVVDDAPVPSFLWGIGTLVGGLISFVISSIGVGVHESEALVSQPERFAFR